MKVIRAFRNIDRHGQQRAPEVIKEEVRQLEPHLVRLREDLVRLEVVASQTKGKTRIHVSLRLQLPSGVIAAEGERRELFFDLIEDHLDTVYDTARRELTYLECSGSVLEGYLSVREDDVTRIVQYARAYLREKLRDSGHSSDTARALFDSAHHRGVRIPQPLQDRARLERAFLGDNRGEAS